MKDLSMERGNLSKYVVIERGLVYSHVVWCSKVDYTFNL